MRITFPIIMLILMRVTSFGQLPNKAMKKMGQNPVFFLDSVQVELGILQTLNPFDISNIRLIRPKKAKKLIGDQGKDGAIYVTTVKAAKEIYWNFFRAKSDEYKQLISSPMADTIVQYVLNGQALSDSAAPGSFFLINDKNFRSLQVLDKEKLLSDNIIPKRYLVAIMTTRIKGIIKTSKSK